MDELEEKVRAYRTLAKQIAEGEKNRKELGSEILKMLTKDKKIYYVADYRVQRAERISIKTTLEEARKIGMTKMEEVLDKDEIKRQFALGQYIPNVEMVESIAVFDQKKEEV